MKIGLILSAALLFSFTVSAGAMSEIHLETQEAIFYHFDGEINDVIDMRFGGAAQGCYFVIEATALTYSGPVSCAVCFEGQGRSFSAKSVSCED
jgi:hypothetical protein